MHHIQVLSNQRHLHKPSAFGRQEKPPCFVMCVHVTSHNSRLWVHPARLHKQSASQSQDVVTAAIWQCLMCRASVADGRPRLVMQQCTVVTLTIHFTLQAASAGQTRGMGAIPHKPGGTHPPRAAVSLPLVYSRCQWRRGYITVYMCTLVCVHVHGARTSLKRQLVVIKCNDMYMSTDSFCVGSHLCCNARKLLLHECRSQNLLYSMQNHHAELFKAFAGASRSHFITKLSCNRSARLSSAH